MPDELAAAGAEVLTLDQVRIATASGERPEGACAFART
jgi:hypothetical protein